MYVELAVCGLRGRKVEYLLLLLEASLNLEPVKFFTLYSIVSSLSRAATHDGLNIVLWVLQLGAGDPHKCRVRTRCCVT